MQTPTPTPTKNKTTAGLLALLLGGLGAHKFYLGNLGAGFLYVFFCWTFIPALVGFVEGIILISMTDANFASRYLVADAARAQIGTQTPAQ